MKLHNTTQGLIRQMLMGLLQKSRHPSRLFAAKTLQAHTTGQALTWAFHYLPLIFTSALELHFPDDNIEANALQATCPELELGEWSSSSIWDPTLSWIALKLYRNIPLSRSFHNLKIPNSSIRTHSSFSWLPGTTPWCAVLTQQGVWWGMWYVLRSCLPLPTLGPGLARL